MENKVNDLTSAIFKHIMEVTTENPINNTSDATSSAPPHRYQTEDDIIKFLTLYFAPFLLFFGTLGNLLSWIVFSQTSLCKSTTAFYFRILAIADTVALNVGLWPNWMRDAFELHLYQQTDAACRIQTYLKYVLPDFAVWVLVIMTVERLVGVWWPHRVHHIFTRPRIWASVVLMAAAMAAVNIPSLWIRTRTNTTDMDRYLCRDTNKESLLYRSWPWVDLTIYSILPFVTMITCNSLICRTVFYRRRALARRASISNNKHHSVHAMTITLLTVTFVFLCLTAPFVCYAVSLAVARRKLYRVVHVRLFHIFASFLRYINNSVNFPLYCMSGKTFRSELLRLFKRENVRRWSRSSTMRTEIGVISHGRTSLSSTRYSIVSTQVGSRMIIDLVGDKSSRWGHANSGFYHG